MPEITTDDVGPILDAYRDDTLPVRGPQLAPTEAQPHPPHLLYRSRPHSLIDWLRQAAGGWPGPDSAAGTRADDEVSQEKVRGGPGGVILPWFAPYLDDQTAETEGMRLAYRRMWADSTVKAAILGKILSVCALDLNVIPADAKGKKRVSRKNRDRNHERVAEFCRWNFNERVQGCVPELAWAILSGGLTDGYSISEKVWRHEERGQYRGKYILSALKPKDAGNDCVLMVDEFRNVVGVQALRYSGGEVYSPANFVIFKHLSLFGQPSGMSDLRAAYSRWWMLDTVQKLRAMGLEKRALPLLLGEYETTAQKPSVEAALALARSMAWMSVPKGVRIEAVNIAGAADGMFASAIADLKEDIFLAIQGATLQALTGQEGQMRGNSKVHKSTSDLFRWYLARSLEVLFNDADDGLIRDLVDLNFVVDDYPRAVLGAIDTADLLEELQLDQGLLSLGLRLSKDELYEKYSRTPPDDDDPDDVLEQQKPGGGLPFSAFADDDESEAPRRGPTFLPPASLNGALELGHTPVRDPETGDWIVGDESIDPRDLDGDEDSDAEEFADDDDKSAWVEYTGKRGGRGWRNTVTGAIVYGGERPGGSVRDHKAKEETHKRKAKEVLASGVKRRLPPGYAKEEAARINEMLPHLSHEEVADLVGAQGGSTVRVSAVSGRGEVKIAVDHPFVTYCDRTIHRTKDGETVCHNDIFFLKKRYRRGGFGMAQFSAQVKACAEAGIHAIETLAGRGNGMNGYYTWARLGYDAPLNETFKAKLPEGLKGAETVQDLMATPEGREFWKQKGYMTNMRFDLAPGSRSRQVLDAYLAEKGKPPLDIDDEKVGRNQDALRTHAQESTERKAKEAKEDNRQRRTVHLEASRKYAVDQARMFGLDPQEVMNEAEEYLRQRGIDTSPDGTGDAYWASRIANAYMVAPYHLAQKRQLAVFQKPGNEELHAEYARKAEAAGLDPRKVFSVAAISPVVGLASDEETIRASYEAVLKQAENNTWFKQKPAAHAEHFVERRWDAGRDWVKVTSSNVEAVRYDSVEEILQVEFHDGSRYAYSHVGPAEAAGLLAASSKGTWIWDNIRVRGEGNARKTRKPFGRFSGHDDYDEEFEQKHPRKGGKFARKGEGGGSSSDSDDDHEPDPEPAPERRQPEGEPETPEDDWGQAVGNATPAADHFVKSARAREQARQSLFDRAMSFLHGAYGRLRDGIIGMGSAAFSALPQGFQRTLSAVGSWAGGVASTVGRGLMQIASKAAAAYHWLEHNVLAAPGRLIQSMAVQAAKEKGLDDKEAEKLGRVLQITDSVFAWSVNIPVAHELLHHVAHVGGWAGFGLAKIGYFLPVASLAYCAWSAVTNPLAMWRAAKKALSGQAGRATGQNTVRRKGRAATATQHAEPSAPLVGAELAGVLAGKWKAAGQRADWWQALYAAAFDQTHDARQAIALADAAITEAPPEVRPEECLDLLDYAPPGASEAHAEWEEEKHPRDEGGRFSQGSGGAAPTESGGSEDEEDDGNDEAEYDGEGPDPMYAHDPVKPAAERTERRFGQLAREARDTAEAGVRKLSPQQYNRLPPIIVEENTRGGLSIVDGFHRVAGLLLWAEDNDVNLDTLDVDMIVVRGGNSTLVGHAAEPGEKQDRALEEIYRRAGMTPDGLDWADDEPTDHADNVDIYTRGPRRRP